MTYLLLFSTLNPSQLTAILYLTYKEIDMQSLNIHRVKSIEVTLKDIDIRGEISYAKDLEIVDENGNIFQVTLFADTIEALKF